MLSYEHGAETVELVQVAEDPGGYKVTFPKGKRGILATKFRGPKSWYRFYNNDERKFYQWGKNDPETNVNEFLTLDFAEKIRSEKVPKFEKYYISDWEELNDTEKDLYIDSYFEEAYMYGLAKDFNLDVEVDVSQKPVVGMVTDFYRKVLPPKKGERFENVIVTKFASKEGKEPISGEHTVVDAEIAASIYSALTRKEETSFNPEEFGKNSDDSQEDEFSQAA
jgi:hypothetical protein